MKGVSWNSLLKEKDMSYRLREVPWGLFQQTFGQWNEGEWEEQVKVGSLYMHMYVHFKKGQDRNRSFRNDSVRDGSTERQGEG